MKHLKTFEQFVNENNTDELNSVNEGKASKKILKLIETIRNIADELTDDSVDDVIINTIVDAIGENKEVIKKLEELIEDMRDEDN